MKKITLSLLLITSSIIGLQAQGIKGLINKTKEAIAPSTGDSLSTSEVGSGLKEALRVGVEKGTARVSAADGFFKDAAIKILMPEEAQKVEQKLRGMGMGKLVDDAIESMNHAAEDAAKSASPIFINAIKQMTIQDAMGILRGSDNSATEYLKGKTTVELTTAFRPVIEQSLEKTGATKHWTTLFSNYNRFALNKINPDLAAFVTEKALAGIFLQIALEEKQIRRDPLARTSDLLKKVFGK